MTFDLSPLTLRKEDHHNTPQQQMDKLPQEYPKSSLQLHSTTDLQFTIGLTVALAWAHVRSRAAGARLQSLASIGASPPEIRAFKRSENSRSTSSQGGEVFVALPVFTQTHRTQPWLRTTKGMSKKKEKKKARNSPLSWKKIHSSNRSRHS